MKDPLVTVYVPSHNYGRYLRDAIKSVSDQSYERWELIVVDDGSDDGTHEILKEFDTVPGIRVLRNGSPKGLRAVANKCIMEAQGEYVLRLDADDLLHPKALELLVREALTGVDIGMVFPDFYYMDEHGRVIGVENLPVLNGRYEARSFPPHGACSLVRRDLILQFGGYDETLRRQDGHELWLRLFQAGIEARHIELPLFYYRKHPISLSSDESLLLADRAAINRKLRGERDRGTVTGILTVCDTNPEFPDIPFTPFQGSTLLGREIEEALRVPEFDRLVVTTDSERVTGYVGRNFPSVTVIERAAHLRHHDAKMREILQEVALRLGLPAEATLSILSLHTPFRRAEHVQAAVDHYNLYQVDSTVTVYEERNLAYQMGYFGLEPINPSWQYMLRREREVVYVENSAVRVLPASNLQQEQFLGTRIGHVVLGRDEGFKINSPEDLYRLSMMIPRVQAQALEPHPR